VPSVLTAQVWAPPALTWVKVFVGVGVAVFVGVGVAVLVAVAVGV
jgi:hypothetical protein